jgi:Flp pilus assembly protein TadD
VDSETKSPSQTEAERLLEQAYTYKEADKFEDVLREADAAIRIAPSLAEAHNLRGIALEELGHRDEALKAYRQAVSLDPEFREAKNNLSDLEARPHLEQAYTYKEADKFEDVLREADAAIAIDPSLAEAHNLRGIALEALGREDEAIKAYKQAISLDPEFREAKNNLSDLGIDPAEKHQPVPITDYRNPIEASIGKAILDSEGIFSVVLHGQLCVRETDEEKARELLSGKPDISEADSEPVERPWPLSLLQRPFTRRDKRERIPPSKERKKYRDRRSS